MWDMVKKKNTVTKNLQVFVRNIIFLKTSSNNIPSNVNYTDLIRSRNNSEVHQTESKALRVKNIQTHGNANPFFFSTSNSLLKYCNRYKSIIGKATGSSKSIQRESRHNRIDTKLANFNWRSHQSADHDDINDEDSGIEDIFEDNDPLNATPVLDCYENKIIRTGSKL